MCLTRVRTYVYPDGREEVVSLPEYCPRSDGIRLCRRHERREYDKQQISSSSMGSPSLVDDVTQPSSSSSSPPIPVSASSGPRYELRNSMAPPKGKGKAQRFIRISDLRVEKSQKEPSSQHTEQQSTGVRSFSDVDFDNMAPASTPTSWGPPLPLPMYDAQNDWLSERYTEGDPDDQIGCDDTQQNLTNRNNDHGSRIKNSIISGSFIRDYNTALNKQGVDDVTDALITNLRTENSALSRSPADSGSNAEDSNPSPPTSVEDELEYHSDSWESVEELMDNFGTFQPVRSTSPDSSVSSKSAIGTEDKDQELIENDIANVALSLGCLPNLRFVNPEQWKMRLEHLERKIAEHSVVLETLRLGSQPPPLPSSTDGLTVNLDWNNANVVLFGFHQVANNIRRLKDAKYCSDCIPIVILPRHRSRANVANIQLIEVSDTSLSQIRDQLFSVGMCSGLLSEWGVPHHPENSILENASIFVQFLDLAVLSFSGAHLEPFFERYVPNPPDCVQLETLFLLRRRRMHCLDQFMGEQEVWVFEPAPENGSANLSNEKLYLRTRIEDFNELWGPVWKISCPGSDLAIRYDVAPGSIFQWPRTETEPMIEDDESFCHWTNNEDQIDCSTQSGIRTVKATNASPFKDYLLVGGVLKEKADCQLDHQQFTTRILDQGRLHCLGAHHRVWERDAIAVGGQLSLGGMGATTSGSYSETFKRRETLYRDDFLAMWEHSPRCLPLEVLLKFFAVQISACTGNARRVRLATVLGSTVMADYLRSLSPPVSWPSSECEEEYFNSLFTSNLQRLKDHYAHDTCCQKACFESMSRCMVALLKTGVNKNNLLTALWIPKIGDVYTVTFPQFEFAWTGLLKEGTDNVLVAVLSEVCLTIDQPILKIYCQSEVQPILQLYTVLETRLLLNSILAKDGKPQGLQLKNNTSGHNSALRKSYEQRWSINNVPRGSTFDLAEQGTLRVIDRIHPNRKKGLPSGLFVTWKDWTPSRLRNAHQFVREIVGLTPIASCHREMIDESLTDGVCPLLVLVSSQR